MINHNPERSSRYIFCAQSGSTITINDGTFINDRQNNSYFWADNATIHVKGGNFEGSTSKNKVVLTNGGQLIISGGTFNFDPTQWLAPGYVAAKNGSKWVVSPETLVSDATEFAEAIKAGNDGKVIILAAGATIEGTFTIGANNLTIKSASSDDKAVIAGRVNVGSVDCSFENINFKITDASKHKNTYSGAPYQYPGIVVGYGAAMTFEGCDFESSISTGVCGINAGNHADSSDLLTVNNCTFVGDFYAIRTRTLFNITNNVFDIYTDQGTLAAVWTWGNASTGADKVTFTGNTNQNANQVYSVQMIASNFVYDYVTINVQDNTNFRALEDGVNPARFNGTHTFVEGSERF